MTKEENKILGDLQERNAILQQCLEDVTNAYDLSQAKEDAQQCLEALAVESVLTPVVPMWIGVEIPTSFGYYRLCLGINQEDGHSASFCNETDMQDHEDNPANITSPWKYDAVIVVVNGTEERVFNDKHDFI